MKKILSFFMGILLLASFCVSASAAERTAIESLKLSLTAPEGYYAFYRDDADGISGKNAKTLGKDYDAVNTTMKTQNVYFDAIKTDANGNVLGEFMISMTSNTGSEVDYDNFSSMSDADINKLYSSMYNQITASGFECQYKDIRTVGGAKYLCYKTSYGTSKYTSVYATLYNGKFVNVVFHSYNDDVTDAEEEKLSELVQSIDWDEEPVETKGGKSPFISVQAGIVIVVSAVVLVVFVVMILVNSKKEKEAKASKKQKISESNRKKK